MRGLGTARARVVNQVLGWGRGVYVVGMHRSGTSAATRVINLLGPALGDPEDLIGAMPDSNPTGHWESASLTELNDRILEVLGGSWSAPPALPAGWEAAPAIAALREPARRAFAHTYASRQWTWKDPRICLTLPFWRRYLPARAVAVLVVRHPLEIAASLRQRNGFPEPVGLALWETYMRAAVAHVAGVPVLVAGYEALLRDPQSWSLRALDFLKARGFRTTEPDPAEIATFVDPSLRHTEAAGADGDRLTASQRALYELLLGLPPVYQAMPALELPPLNPARIPVA